MIRNTDDDAIELESDPEPESLVVKNERRLDAAAQKRKKREKAPKKPLTGLYIKQIIDQGPLKTIKKKAEEETPKARKRAKTAAPKAKPARTAAPKAKPARTAAPKAKPARTAAPKAKPAKTAKAVKAPKPVKKEAGVKAQTQVTKHLSKWLDSEAKNEGVRRADIIRKALIRGARGYGYRLEEG